MKGERVMATKFVKGHKRTRRTLKHLLTVVERLYEHGTYEQMCALSWKMYLITQTLPKDDDARRYEREAYKLAYRRDDDDEYAFAQWIVV